LIAAKEKAEAISTNESFVYPLTQSDLGSKLSNEMGIRLLNDRSDFIP